MGKTKMQMLLFSWSFSFWGICIVCIFFLFKRPKNVTLCYMNVCILIYLWFAKMKIWSMLQVLLKENEKEKRITAYVFVPGGNTCLFGGISGSKNGQKVAKPQDYKGSISFTGRSAKWILKILCSPENFLVPKVMSLLPLTRWSCSRCWIGLWVTPSTRRSGLTSPSHRSRISLTSLCFKSHL